MTKAKPGTRKMPRKPRSERASIFDERRASVDRAVDEIVEAAIDDLVERSPDTPGQASEAERDAAVAVDAGKQKLVRDSFTMPKDEHRTLDLLKTRLLRLSHSAKKSELLRAGVAALARMSDRQLLAAIAVVPSLKTGRPKGRTGIAEPKKKR